MTALPAHRAPPILAGLLLVLGAQAACSSRPAKGAVDLTADVPGTYLCTVETSSTNTAAFENAPPPARPSESSFRAEMRVVVEPPGPTGRSVATLRFTRIQENRDGERLDTSTPSTYGDRYEVAPLLVRASFSAARERGGSWAETGSDLETVFLQAFQGNPRLEELKRLLLPALRAPAFRNMVATTLNPGRCFGASAKVGDACQTSAPVEFPVIGQAAMEVYARIEGIKPSPIGEVAEVVTSGTLSSSAGGPFQVGEMKGRLENVRIDLKGTSRLRVGNVLVGAVVQDLELHADVVVDPPLDGIRRGTMSTRVKATQDCIAAPGT